MKDNLKIHKFHIKNLNKTDSRAISFVESIESIDIPKSVEDKIEKEIIKSRFFSKLIKDRSKNKNLVRLFSILKLSNIQLFFKELEKDKDTMHLIIKVINREIIGEEYINNMIERIVVIHKIAIIKQIFSEERMSSAEEAIKNYK